MISDKVEVGKVYKVLGLHEQDMRYSMGIDATQKGWKPCGCEVLFCEVWQRHGSSFGGWAIITKGNLSTPVGEYVCFAGGYFQEVTK